MPSQWLQRVPSPQRLAWAMDSLCRGSREVDSPASGVFEFEFWNSIPKCQRRAIHKRIRRVRQPLHRICAGNSRLLKSTHILTFDARRALPRPSSGKLACFNPYRGTSLIRKRHPPWDRRRIIGIGLLVGPRRWCFLMSERPLYRFRAKREQPETFQGLQGKAKARIWP